MNYVAPTAIEVRTILNEFNLSGSEAAKQTGMKNSRTFRKFTAEGAANKELPYTVLFTLVAKNLGIFVTAGGWKDSLISEKVLHQKKPNYMSL